MLYGLASAAPTTATWQSLFNLYVELGTVAGVVVIAWLLYYLVKYRARSSMAAKVEAKEETWKGAVATLAVTGTVLFIVQFQTFASFGLIVPPPQALNSGLHINVVGRQWSWTFIYPNGYSSGNLTVPAGQDVVLNVTSRDVTHSIFIPSLAVGIDATPGRNNIIWFNQPQTGTFVIRCRELCGIGHAGMFTKLVVLTPSAYQSWYSKLGVAKA